VTIGLRDERFEAILEGVFLVKWEVALWHCLRLWVSLLLLRRLARHSVAIPRGAEAGRKVRVHVLRLLLLALRLLVRDAVAAMIDLLLRILNLTLLIALEVRGVFGEAYVHLQRSLGLTARLRRLDGYLDLVVRADVGLLQCIDQVLNGAKHG